MTKMRIKGAKKKLRNQIFKLEERVLFDGAAAAEIVETVNNAGQQQNQQDSQDSDQDKEQQLINLAVQAAGPVDTPNPEANVQNAGEGLPQADAAQNDPAEVLINGNADFTQVTDPNAGFSGDVAEFIQAADPVAEAADHELIVIDSEAADQFDQDAFEGKNVLFLNGDSDAADQIEDWMNEHSDQDINEVRLVTDSDTLASQISDIDNLEVTAVDAFQAELADAGSSDLVIVPDPEANITVGIQSEALPDELTQDAEAGRHELVIVNSTTAELDNVLDQLGDSRDILVIDASSELSGIEQIQNYLAEHNEIQYDAVHIMTHGNDTGFYLGSDRLTDANDLVVFDGHLTDHADFMLYGCNTASSEAGQAFIQNIADVTGADVAASTDITGSAELNGNWNLEYSIGEITADSISLDSSWNYRLATIIVDGTDDATHAPTVQLAISGGSGGSGETAWTRPAAVGGDTIDVQINDTTSNPTITVAGLIITGHDKTVSGTYTIDSGGSLILSGTSLSVNIAGKGDFTLDAGSTNTGNVSTSGNVTINGTNTAGTISGFSSLTVGSGGKVGNISIGSTEELAGQSLDISGTAGNITVGTYSTGTVNVSGTGSVVGNIQFYGSGSLTLADGTVGNVTIYTGTGESSRTVNITASVLGNVQINSTRGDLININLSNTQDTAYGRAGAGNARTISFAQGSNAHLTIAGGYFGSQFTLNTGTDATGGVEISGGTFHNGSKITLMKSTENDLNISNGNFLGSIEVKGGQYDAETGVMVHGLFISGGTFGGDDSLMALAVTGTAADIAAARISGGTFVNAQINVSSVNSDHPAYLYMNTGLKYQGAGTAVTVTGSGSRVDFGSGSSITVTKISAKGLSVGGGLVEFQGSVNFNPDDPNSVSTGTGIVVNGGKLQFNGSVGTAASRFATGIQANGGLTYLYDGSTVYASGTGLDLNGGDIYMYGGTINAVIPDPYTVGTGVNVHKAASDFVFAGGKINGTLQKTAGNFYYYVKIDGSSSSAPVENVFRASFHDLDDANTYLTYYRNPDHGYPTVNFIVYQAGSGNYAVSSNQNVTFAANSAGDGSYVNTFFGRLVASLDSATSQTDLDIMIASLLQDGFYNDSGTAVTFTYNAGGRVTVSNVSATQPTVLTDETGSAVFYYDPVANYIYELTQFEVNGGTLAILGKGTANRSVIYGVDAVVNSGIMVVNQITSNNSAFTVESNGRLSVGIKEAGDANIKSTFNAYTLSGLLGNALLTNKGTTYIYGATFGDPADPADPLRGGTIVNTSTGTMEIQSITVNGYRDEIMGQVGRTLNAAISNSGSLLLYDDSSVAAVYNTKTIGTGGLYNTGDLEISGTVSITDQYQIYPARAASDYKGSIFSDDGIVTISTGAAINLNGGNIRINSGELHFEGGALTGNVSLSGVYKGFYLNIHNETVMGEYIPNNISLTDTESTVVMLMSDGTITGTVTVGDDTAANGDTSKASFVFTGGSVTNVVNRGGLYLRHSGIAAIANNAAGKVYIGVNLKDGAAGGAGAYEFASLADAVNAVAADNKGDYNITGTGGVFGEITIDQDYTGGLILPDTNNIVAINTQRVLDSGLELNTIGDSTLGNAFRPTYDGHELTFGGNEVEFALALNGEVLQTGDKVLAQNGTGDDYIVYVYLRGMNFAEQDVTSSGTGENVRIRFADAVIEVDGQQRTLQRVGDLLYQKGGTFQNVYYANGKYYAYDFENFTLEQIDVTKAVLFSEGNKINYNQPDQAFMQEYTDTLLRNGIRYMVKADTSAYGGYSFTKYAKVQIGSNGEILIGSPGYDGQPLTHPDNGQNDPDLNAATDLHNLDLIVTYAGYRAGDVLLTNGAEIGGTDADGNEVSFIYRFLEGRVQLFENTAKSIRVESTDTVTLGANADTLFQNTALAVTGGSFTIDTGSQVLFAGQGTISGSDQVTSTISVSAGAGFTVATGAELDMYSAGANMITNEGTMQVDGTVSQYSIITDPNREVTGIANSGTLNFGDAAANVQGGSLTIEGVTVTGVKNSETGTFTFYNGRLDAEGFGSGIGTGLSNAGTAVFTAGNADRDAVTLAELVEESGYYHTYIKGSTYSVSNRSIFEISGTQLTAADVTGRYRFDNGTIKDAAVIGLQVSGISTAVLMGDVLVSGGTSAGTFTLNNAMILGDLIVNGDQTVTLSGLQLDGTLQNGTAETAGSAHVTVKGGFSDLNTVTLSQTVETRSRYIYAFTETAVSNYGTLYFGDSADSVSFDAYNRSTPVSEQVTYHITNAGSGRMEFNNIAAAGNQIYGTLRNQAGATLIVDDVNDTVVTFWGSNEYAGTIENAGTMTLKDVSVINLQKGSYALYNRAGGELTMSVSDANIDAVKISGINYGLFNAGAATLTDVLYVYGGNRAVSNSGSLTLAVSNAARVITIGNNDAALNFTEDTSRLDTTFYGIYNTAGSLTIVQDPDDADAAKGILHLTGRQVRQDQGTAVYSTGGTVTILNLQSNLGRDLTDEQAAHLPNFTWMTNNSGSAQTDITFNFAVAANSVVNAATLTLRGFRNPHVYTYNDGTWSDGSTTLIPTDGTQIIVKGTTYTYRTTVPAGWYAPDATAASTFDNGTATDPFVGSIYGITNEGVVVQDNSTLNLYNVALVSKADQSQSDTAIVTISASGTLNMENEDQSTITLTPAGGSAIVNRGTLTINKVTADMDGNTARFLTNEGGTATLTDIYVMRGNMDKGGAIYLNGGTVKIYGTDTDYSHAGSVTVHGTEFYRNAATADGGAIYIASGNLNINSNATADGYVTFDSNTAAGNGGAIYNNGGTISARGKDRTNSLVFDNSADVTLADKGGYLYNNAGNATFTNAQFINGSVSSDGGAVYGKGGTVVLNSVLLGVAYDNAGDEITTAGNTAVNGGAVYNNGATISVVGDAMVSRVAYNSATGSGGAFYNQSGTLVIAGADGGQYNNTLVYNNSATGNGGAVYIGGGELVLNRASLDHNTAADGSALYIAGNAVVDAVNTTIAYNGSNAGAGDGSDYAIRLADDSTAKLYLVDTTVGYNWNGIYNDAADSVVYLVNSIVLNNGTDTYGSHIENIGNYSLVGGAALTDVFAGWNEKYHTLGLNLDNPANPASLGTLIAYVDTPDYTGYLYRDVTTSGWLELNGTPYQATVPDANQIVRDQLGRQRSFSGENHYVMGSISGIAVGQVFVVTTALDNTDAGDGKTSLREAIAMVNAAGDGTIVFDVTQIGTLNSIVTINLVSELTALADGVSITISGIDSEYNPNGVPIVINGGSVNAPVFTIGENVNSFSASDLTLTSDVQSLVVVKAGDSDPYSHANVILTDMTFETAGTVEALSVRAHAALTLAGTTSITAAKGIQSAGDLVLNGTVDIQSRTDSAGFIGINNTGNANLTVNGNVTVTNRSNNAAAFTGISSTPYFTMADTSSLTVTNEGTVTGAFIGVDYQGTMTALSQTLQGTVTVTNAENASAGSFTGVRLPVNSAVLYDTAALSVINDGAVTDSFTGIEMNGTSLELSEAPSITNRGTVGGNFTGINVTHGSFTVDSGDPDSPLLTAVTNAGSVTGTFTGLSTSNPGSVTLQDVMVSNSGSAGTFIGLSNAGGDSVISGALTVRSTGSASSMTGVSNTSADDLILGAVTVEGTSGAFKGIYNTGSLDLSGNPVTITHTGSGTAAQTNSGIDNTGILTLGTATISLGGFYGYSSLPTDNATITPDSTVYGIRNSGAGVLNFAAGTVSINGSFNSGTYVIPDPEHPVTVTVGSNNAFIGLASSSTAADAVTQAADSGINIQSSNRFLKFTGVDVSGSTISQAGTVTVSQGAQLGGVRFQVPQGEGQQPKTVTLRVDSPFVGMKLASSAAWNSANTLTIENTGSVQYANGSSYGIYTADIGSLTVFGATTTATVSNEEGVDGGFTGIQNVAVTVNGGTLAVGNSGSNSFTGISTTAVAVNEGILTVENTGSADSFTGIATTVGLTIGSADVSDGAVRVTNSGAVSGAFTGVTGAVTLNGDTHAGNFLNVLNKNTVGGAFTGVESSGLDLTVGSVNVSNENAVTGLFTGFTGAGTAAADTVLSVINKVDQESGANGSAGSFLGISATGGDLTLNNAFTVLNQGAVTDTVTLLGSGSGSNLTLNNSGAAAGSSGSARNFIGILAAGTVTVNADLFLTNSGAVENYIGAVVSAGSTLDVNADLTLNNSGAASVSYTGVDNAGTVTVAEDMELSLVNTAAGAAYTGVNNAVTGTLDVDGDLTASNSGALSGSYTGVNNAGTLTVSGTGTLSADNSGSFTSYTGLVNSGSLTGAANSDIEFVNTGSGTGDFTGVSNTGAGAISASGSFTVDNQNSTSLDSFTGLRNNSTGNSVFSNAVISSTSGLTGAFVGVKNDQGTLTFDDTLTVTNSGAAASFTGLANGSDNPAGLILSGDALSVDNNGALTGAFTGMQNDSDAEISGTMTVTNSGAAASFTGLRNSDSLTVTGTVVLNSTGAAETVTGVDNSGVFQLGTSNMTVKSGSITLNSAEAAETLTGLANSGTASVYGDFVLNNTAAAVNLYGINNSGVFTLSAYDSAAAAGDGGSFTVDNSAGAAMSLYGLYNTGTAVLQGGDINGMTNLNVYAVDRTGTEPVSTVAEMFTGLYNAADASLTLQGGVTVTLDFTAPGGRGIMSESDAAGFVFGGTNVDATTDAAPVLRNVSKDDVTVVNKVGTGFYVKAIEWGDSDQTDGANGTIQGFSLALSGDSAAAYDAIQSRIAAKRLVITDNVMNYWINLVVTATTSSGYQFETIDEALTFVVDAASDPILSAVGFNINFELVSNALSNWTNAVTVTGQYDIGSNLFEINGNDYKYSYDPAEHENSMTQIILASGAALHFAPDTTSVSLTMNNISLLVKSGAEMTVSGNSSYDMGMIFVGDGRNFTPDPNQHATVEQYISPGIVVDGGTLTVTNASLINNAGIGMNSDNPVNPVASDKVVTAIAVYGSGTVTLESSSLLVNTWNSGDQKTYGIYNESGTVSISGGSTVSVSATGEASAAVYNYGTLTVGGDNDGSLIMLVGGDNEVYAVQNLGTATVTDSWIKASGSGSRGVFNGTSGVMTFIVNSRPNEYITDVSILSGSTDVMRDYSKLIYSITGEGYAVYNQNLFTATSVEQTYTGHDAVNDIDYDWAPVAALNGNILEIYKASGTSSALTLTNMTINGNVQLVGNAEVTWNNFYLNGNLINEGNKITLTGQFMSSRAFTVADAASTYAGIYAGSITAINRPYKLGTSGSIQFGDENTAASVEFDPNRTYEFFNYSGEMSLYNFTGLSSETTPVSIYNSGTFVMDSDTSSEAAYDLYVKSISYSDIVRNGSRYSYNTITEARASDSMAQSQLQGQGHTASGISDAGILNFNAWISTQKYPVANAMTLRDLNIRNTQNASVAVTNFAGNLTVERGSLQGTYSGLDALVKVESRSVSTSDHRWYVISPETTLTDVAKIAGGAYSIRNSGQLNMTAENVAGGTLLTNQLDFHTSYSGNYVALGNYVFNVSMMEHYCSETNYINDLNVDGTSGVQKYSGSYKLGSQSPSPLSPEQFHLYYVSASDMETRVEVSHEDYYTSVSTTGSPSHTYWYYGSYSGKDAGGHQISGYADVSDVAFQAKATTGINTAIQNFGEIVVKNINADPEYQFSGFDRSIDNGFTTFWSEYGTYVYITISADVEIGFDVPAASIFTSDSDSTFSIGMLTLRGVATETMNFENGDKVTFADDETEYTWDGTQWKDSSGAAKAFTPGDKIIYNGQEYWYDGTEYTWDGTQWKTASGSGKTFAAGDKVTFADDGKEYTWDGTQWRNVSGVVKTFTSGAKVMFPEDGKAWSNGIYSGTMTVSGAKYVVYQTQLLTLVNFSVTTAGGDAIENNGALYVFNGSGSVETGWKGGSNASITADGGTAIINRGFLLMFNGAVLNSSVGIDQRSDGQMAVINSTFYNNDTAIISAAGDPGSSSAMNLVVADTTIVSAKAGSTGIQLANSEGQLDLVNTVILVNGGNGLVNNVGATVEEHGSQNIVGTAETTNDKMISVYGTDFDNIGLLWNENQNVLTLAEGSEALSGGISVSYITEGGFFEFLFNQTPTSDAVSITWDKSGNLRESAIGSYVLTGIPTPTVTIIVNTVKDSDADPTAKEYSLRYVLDYLMSGDNTSGSTTVEFDWDALQAEAESAGAEQLLFIVDNGTLGIFGNNDAHITEITIDVSGNTTGLALTIGTDQTAASLFTISGMKVTLTGADAGTFTINGSGKSDDSDDFVGVDGAAFNLADVSDTSLVLSNLTVTGGNTTGNGGAVYVGGANASLSATGVTFSYNTAANGGAIYNNGGTVTVDGTMTHNSATGSSTTPVTGGNGGAIYSTNGMTVSGALSYNDAVNGGAIYNAAGTATISASLSNNSASGNGGALFNAGTATVSSTVKENNALNGAGIYNTGTLTAGALSDNGTATTANGGALYNTGTAEISGDITGNKAANGAGVYNTGSLTVTGNVNLSGNIASGDGGALYNDAGTATITGSITGNRAANGAGIYTTGSTTAGRVTLNGDLTGNIAGDGTGEGAALYIDGGKFSTNGNVTGSNEGASIIYASDGMAQFGSLNHYYVRMSGNNGILVKAVGGDVLIVNASITGNDPATAALFDVSAAGVFTMLNTTVTANSGDVLTQNGGTVQIGDSTIYEPDGAVNFYGGTLDVINSIIKVSNTITVTPDVHVVGSLINIEDEDVSKIFVMKNGEPVPGANGTLQIRLAGIAGQGGVMVGYTQDAVKTTLHYTTDGSTWYDADGSTAASAPDYVVEYSQNGLKRLYNGYAFLSIGAFSLKTTDLSLVVTISGDESVEGETTLREAVEYAEYLYLTEGTVETVTFQVSDVYLTSTITIDNPVVLSGSVTIHSTDLGPAPLSFAGDSVFAVDTPDSEVKFQDITIEGQTGVRGIRVDDGSLVLKNVTIENGVADGSTGSPAKGGAIYVSGGGSVIGKNVTLRNNSAEDGAAIYSDGSVELDGFTVAGNVQTGTAGGVIHVTDANSTLFLQDGTITANDSAGALLETNGTAVLVSVSIADNGDNDTVGSSLLKAASADIVNSTITGNTADGSALVDVTYDVNVANSVIVTSQGSGDAVTAGSILSAYSIYSGSLENVDVDVENMTGARFSDLYSGSYDGRPVPMEESPASIGVWTMYDPETREIAYSERPEDIWTVKYKPENMQWRVLGGDLTTYNSTYLVGGSSTMPSIGANWIQSGRNHPDYGPGVDYSKFNPNYNGGFGDDWGYNLAVDSYLADPIVQLTGDTESGMGWYASMLSDLFGIRSQQSRILSVTGGIPNDELELSVDADMEDFGEFQEAPYSAEDGTPLSQEELNAIRNAAVTGRVPDDSVHLDEAVHEKVAASLRSSELFKDSFDKALDTLMGLDA